MNLEYKGLKSTRFIALAVIFAFACFFLWFGKIQPGDWVDVVKWAFGAYGLTEGIAKGATAYKEKGQ